MKKITILCIGILQLLALDLLAQGGFTSYPNSFGVANLRTSLKIDPSGNKWMGTTGTASSARGVYKFDGTAWSVYNVTNSGIASNVVNDIAFDGLGNIWFATRAGLSKFDGSVWTTYNVSNSGLASDTVNCLFTEGPNVWAGTKQGLSKFDGSGWVNYNVSNSGIINNSVTALNIDTNGDVWIGTIAGLCIKTLTGWTIYDSNNSNFVIDQVNAICFLNSTTKWIGTNAFGLFKFENNIFTPFVSIAKDKDMIRPNSIYSLSIGPQGGFW